MLDAENTLITELRVLVVDDNIEVCKLIRRALQDLDVKKVTVVTSGDEALKLLGSPDKYGAIDVILCDWNMSGMSGLDLLKHVRSREPNMPFLMITGNTGADFIAEAKKHGVTGYIAKPFAPAALQKKVGVVAQMLAKRREKMSAN